MYTPDFSDSLPLKKCILKFIKTTNYHENDKIRFKSWKYRNHHVLPQIRTSHIFCILVNTLTFLVDNLVNKKCINGIFIKMFKIFVTYKLSYWYFLFWMATPLILGLHHLNMTLSVAKAIHMNEHTWFVWVTFEVKCSLAFWHKLLCLNQQYWPLSHIISVSSWSCDLFKRSVSICRTLNGQPFLVRFMDSPAADMRSDCLHIWVAELAI